MQLVRAVARYHQEKHAKEVKAEREETQKLRRIAGNIAKEIRTFWSNIEKVSCIFWFSAHPYS